MMAKVYDLSTDAAVSFIENYLRAANVKFKGQISNLLKENRRSPALRRNGKLIHKGNRHNFDFLDYIYASKSGENGKVCYNRQDIVTWLECVVIPHLHELAAKK